MPENNLRHTNKTILIFKLSRPYDVTGKNTFESLILTPTSYGQDNFDFEHPRQKSKLSRPYDVTGKIPFHIYIPS